MNGKLTDESVLSQITPSELTAYVKSRGWRNAEPYGDIGHIYELDSATPNIVIPASKHFADYTLVLRRLIDILAGVEERDQRTIVRDLIRADVDQVRFRVSDANDDGSIPAEAGVTLIQQSWNMLRAAARSAWSPQPVLQGRISAQTQNYLKSVRLGQTEEGSFVVNLLSPVQLPNKRFADSEEPFARQVVHTLVSGLQVTKKAPFRSDADFAANPSYHDATEYGVHQGVSSNLCDAVADVLDKAGDASLDISVNWALSKPVYEGRVSVSFDASDISELRNTSAVLREQLEIPGERLTGHVVSLARQRAGDRGRVTMRARINGKDRLVNAILNPSDYGRAGNAHTNGTVVSVTGDLRRQGQRWTLTNPRDLAILDDGHQISREALRDW